MSKTQKIENVNIFTSEIYAPRVVGLDCQDPSLAQQNFRDECDINTIISRWEKTGVMDHMNQNAAEYGVDLSEITDYQTSLNTVMAAQSAFMALPSGIRAAFRNDPASFLSFANDPSNHAAMVEMGLAEPLKTTEGSAPPKSAEATVGAAEGGSNTPS